MGRKIEMKKIQDRTKCQVTFSKRRIGLMKMTQEMADFCGADVALVAFSPSGRVHEFCSKSRIEDVIQRYINLPIEWRLIHIRDIQVKLEKVRQLGHIKGYHQKVDHLRTRVESLQFQIRKINLELQILKDNLCDYEPSSGHDPSLHQLLWSERNLSQSLMRIMARKDELFGRSSLSWKEPNMQVDGLGITNQDYGGLSAQFEFNEKELNRNSFECQLQMEMFNQGQGSMSFHTPCSPCIPSHLLAELDPWISPYSPKVRASMFQRLVDAKGKDVCKENPVKEEPFNQMKGMIIGGNSNFRAQQQHLPSILNQYKGIKIADAAPTVFQPNLLANALSQIGHAPLGFQEHTQKTFGHHVNNPNMQDATSLVNQSNSNYKQQQQPFPFYHLESSFGFGSKLDSSSVGLRQGKLGREMPLLKDKHQATELEFLRLDSRNSVLLNPQSFHPNIDTNFRSWGEGTSHNVGDFSHALGQLDPAPEVHDAGGAKNIWAAGIDQKNGALDWNELIDELLAD